MALRGIFFPSDFGRRDYFGFSFIKPKSALKYCVI